VNIKENEDSQSPTSTSTVKFTNEDISKAIDLEVKFQERDFEIRQFLSAKNSMESYILEMRMAPKRKYGELINSEALTKVG
jgi:hypothetical protein